MNSSNRNLIFLQFIEKTIFKIKNYTTKDLKTDKNK